MALYQPDKKRVYQTFDSIGAYLDAVQPVIDAGGMFRKQSHQTGGRDWDLGAGVKGARDLLAYGWPEGAAKVAQASATLTGDDVAAAGFRPDVGGAFISVPAFLAGDPECFYMYETQPAAAPVIKLLAPVGAAASVEADQYIRRGAALLTVINALESSGLRVELWSEDNTTDSSTGKVTCVLVKVKDADQAVNLNALAGMFCHPATFRRLGFCMIELAADKYLDGFCSGYGHNKDDVKADALQRFFPEGDAIALPRFYRSGDCLDQLDMVAACLRRIVGAGKLTREQRDALMDAIRKAFNNHAAA